MRYYFITILLILIILVSCEPQEKDPVILHPTTVIGPFDGAQDVSWIPTFVIGEYDLSVDAVVTSSISIGDYTSGPGFLDYIIITKDTLDESKWLKLGTQNYTEYPYPPQPPVNAEIRRTSKAYFYPSDMLEPSTEYYWKVVHNAGDFLLDVIPFRKFTTAPVYNMKETIEMIDVEGGQFCMGAAKCYQASNLNTYVVVNSFRIGKYEITNQQFCNFLNNSNHNFLGGGLLQIFSVLCKIKFDFSQGRWKPLAGMEESPVDAIQWHGALLFCETYGGRLPTEAEWEYAAKGGNKGQGLTFSGSNQPEEVAWFNTPNPNKVGTKNPNELGIHDMSGNVAEWCADWYFSVPNTSAGHAYGTFSNPKGPENGTYKVIRGGSARNMPVPAYSSRTGLYPAMNFEQYLVYNVGFRMARD